MGTKESLSRMPSESEWKELYDMAKKQSLVGVCFAGVQKMCDSDEDFYFGMSEMQYLVWMGMAAKVQQKNRIVDEHCAVLRKQLSSDGFKSSILKGQGVGQLYVEHLRGLRQSGDIDVLMWKDGLSFHENKQEVIIYAQNIDASARGAEHHISVHLFESTEVEMHYAPAYFCNPFANKRFRKWCKGHRELVDSGVGFMMPNMEFNIVFLLAHIFRHYMGEGVGIRQLMDYYFVLNTHSSSPLKGKGLKKTLASLNMLKFAGAVMWVMKEVFCLSEQFLICEPNERIGRKLLARVIQGGNFGHHNTKTVASKESHAGRFLNRLVQDIKLVVDYPGEAIWAPLSMIREFVRIRI